jgi:hypothetical protein
MANKTRILRYAQNSANRNGTPMVIHQCRNGQWLLAPCTDQTITYPKAEVITPQSCVNKVKSPKLLTNSEYSALSALYNNCNDAYRTLSEEWKSAFISRLYSK